MNYAKITSKDSDKNKYNPNNFIKKERYRDTNDTKVYCDSPGFWQYEKKWDVIDAESNLKTPGVGTKHKTNIELVDKLHPNNYEVSVSNKKSVEENIEPSEKHSFSEATLGKKSKDFLPIESKENVYFPGYGTGPGRGFGNLGISNSIRIGDFTRTETKVFKSTKESEVIDRWGFIDDRYQNPHNLVMELPRGGESTRKSQNQLPINKIESDKEFSFRY